MSDDPSGVEAWKAETSAFDRVLSVATTVSQPQPAAYIADEAHVAENTARNHLERLVEMSVLLTSERDGTMLYSPDPLYTRLQMLRDFLEDHDRDGLIELKADLREQVEDWRDEYDAQSPDALRERAAETEDVAEIRDLKKTASDWELVAYRLSVLDEAIRNYETYNHDYRALA